MRIPAMAGLVLLCASAAQAQTQVAATVSIVIPEVLGLDVESGAEVVGPVAAGAHLEASGAVVVRIDANRPWRLLASRRAAEAGGVWLRVRGGEAAAPARFQPVAEAAAEIARGAPGRGIVLVLDLRLSGDVPGAVDPASLLAYRLVAADAAALSPR